MEKKASTRPRILLAADNSHLLLALATLLSDTRTEIVITHSPEELVRLSTHETYELVITTFIWSLLGPCSLSSKMKKCGHTTPIFALLNESHTTQAEGLTIALLQSGVRQVIALPVVGARLHKKVTDQINLPNTHTSYASQKTSR